jgi:hypothetical protein
MKREEVHGRRSIILYNGRRISIAPHNFRKLIPIRSGGIKL